jgi:thioredoxin-like negative regulator of GroEL
MTKRNDRPRRIGIGLGITLACWLGTLCVTVLALEYETISWRTDLHRAELEARAQNRLLWVQFTGSWCPNCVRLERESFIHPRVVGHARNSFIPVKIQSDQHEELVERFGLSGIPATVLVKPSGEFVARHEGFVDAATFGNFLERALIRTGRSPRPPRSELTQTSTSKAGRPGPATVDPKKDQRPGSETVRR